MASTTSNFEELAIARQILNYIMAPSNGNIAFPFMERIDAQSLGLYKYNEIIRYPMWIKKIDEKLNQGKYPGIKEFVCDFRLILVNCFRYNGVVSRMGRIADKLELLFEQKLQLLPADIRAKTSLQASLGCSGVQQQLEDSGLVRRRSSTRLYGSTGDSQGASHPVHALMEELEHAVPHEHILGNGGTTAAAFLYEGLPPGTPSLPVTNENSFTLLIARLTQWQRKQHEEELIASWEDWWRRAECERGRKLQRELRKSPVFLEAYQLLWLVGPFLGLDDALATATSLYHDRDCYLTENDTLSQGFVLPDASSTSASSQRCLTFTELELGLAAAPQASLVLATCVSNLLNTAKEREVVTAAVTALLEQKKSNTANQITSIEAISRLGGDDEEETTRLAAASRRIQSSHMATLRNLSTPPYEVWERRLAARLAFWYEEMPLDKRLEDPVKMERRFGVTQSFFDTCGNYTSPLEKKRFHELTTHQQAHILRALVSSILLATGNYGFADNLRYSLDKSATSDWGATRPTHLGTDPFRGLTYLHFPEMMRAECPRILQYHFPPPDDLSSYRAPPSLAPPKEVAVEVIYLPGPAFRLPSWIEPSVGCRIKSHLVKLIDGEVERLRSSSDAREDKKAAKKELARAQSLARMVELLRDDPPTPRSSQKKRKKRPAPAMEMAEAASEVEVAGFAFLDGNRSGCGPVPLCVTYARQGGGSKGMMRSADSCASLMTESVRSVDAGGNDSDAPADTPTAPNFYQGEEEEEEEDESVVSSLHTKVKHHLEDGEDETQDVSFSAPILSAEETGTEVEEVGRSAVVATGDNHHRNANGGVDADSSSSADTTPCRQDDGDDDDALSDAREEDKPFRCNGFKQENEDDERKVEKHFVKGELREEAKTEVKVEVGAHEDPDADTEKKESTMDVPEFGENGPDSQLAFDTVVYDLASFYALLREISSRFNRGKELLGQLKSATEIDPPMASRMRQIVDEFNKELGDSVARNILMDEKLAATLDGKPQLEENDVEEEHVEEVQEKPKKRRRRTHLGVRPKRSRRPVQQEALKEDELDEDNEVHDRESPPARILRLHEEALNGLQKLHSCLCELEEEVKAAEPERISAYQLAGLRLRKDIEAWEAAKKPRRPRSPPISPPLAIKIKKKETVPPPPPIESNKESMTTSIQQPKAARLPLPPYRPSVAPLGVAARVPAPVYVRPQQQQQRPLSPTPGASPRRIFRFYDTLFTEDARPVRLEANGTMTYLPPESIPLGHRQMARQMIERFRATSAASAGASTPIAVRPAVP